MSQSRPQTGCVSHKRFFAAIILLSVLGSYAVYRSQRIAQRELSSSRASHLIASRTASVFAAYGKLPISFERNDGQFKQEVKYLAHGSGYTLFLTDHEAVLRLRGNAKLIGSQHTSPKLVLAAGPASVPDSVVRISMANSNPAPQLDALDLQSGKTNYLIGNDPSRWRRGVPLYGRVKYRDVYPGVDAIYYGNQRQLETDFVVAPGARTGQIRLQIRGGDQLRLSQGGDLIITTAAGDLTLRRPVAYQESSDGTRREIAANFKLQGTDELAIGLGKYDSTKPVVIDPVIVYSTYLGGANGPQKGLAESSAAAVAVDGSGNAYVVGATDTSDFPTTSGVLQPTNSQNYEYAFVTKFNPTGSGLVYSTFLGGTNGNGASGIAIDSAGDAYVIGGTASSDFPLTNAPIVPNYPPGNTGGTGFFAELDPNGASLLFSTYLGGNSQDGPGGIALDSNGNAYIAGYTSSTNFPLSHALQNTNNAVGAGSQGANNAFLSRIDPTKSGLAALVYSTYLGGPGVDGASAVAVDANFNAYIAGAGSSSDFPMGTNPGFQTSPGGAATAFVARIDTVNSVLVYSSFIGNSAVRNAETGNCIAIDANGNAYIGGQTFDMSFPVTTGAFETTFPGNSGIGTGFVAKFNTAAATGPASLVWATYLGGAISGDQPHAMTIDSLGNLYMTGETWSGEIPNNHYPFTLGAPETTGVAGYQNGFVTVMSNDGTSVPFSTYYGTGGPSENDNLGLGIALDTVSPPDIFIVGLTISQKFPTTAGAFQTSFNGFIDAFLAELSPAAAQGVFATPTSLSFGNQAKGTTSASQAVTLTNNTSNSLTGITFTFTGSNKSDFSQTNTCPGSPPTLTSGTACTINVTFTPSTEQSESASLSIAYAGGSGSPQTVTLTGTGTQPAPGVTLTPTTGNFGSLPKGTASSPQTFTLSNNSAASITITSPGITVTGANAADFVVQPTSTCPAVNGTLAASTTCMINIVFTPSTNGGESATLNVSDTDVSSPQTAALSGSGTAPSGTVTLAPSTLSFGNVNLNSTSPAQTATLSNTETTALTITSVTVTGPNAPDFAQTNTCGTSVAASGNCTISVKFTPTTTAAESATLTVTDSDSTSPQTTALSGTGVATGPDFTISATPSSATVGTHGTVTATVTVTSVDGFASAVTLNGVSLPGDSSIAFTQNPVTPAANGSASTMVTITTSAGVFGSNPPSPSWPKMPPMPAGVGILGILALAAMGMWRFSGRSARRVVCAFALLSVIALASCVGTPSTPTGTYTVKLTGAAGKSTHAFSFTLTVK